MGLKKGTTNNPNGRPAGKPNKVTGEMKVWLSGLLDKNRNQMEKDLKRLEPKERLMILERFMQYTIPKQQAMAAQIDFGSLSDEQLDVIIDALTKDLNNEENSD